MDIKIVFHPSGDWEGLYIDGKLEHEGHNTSLEDFINITNKDDWFFDTSGGFPQVLNYSTRDLGNEEGFDAEDFSFPLKYEDIRTE